MESRKIPLTQGKFAIVDAEDYERLNQHKWYAYKTKHTFYARRNERCGVNKQRTVIMHVDIMKPKLGFEIDHKTHDGLDNRKCNLRAVTKSQNQMNRRIVTSTSSAYKGVHWAKRDKVWIAQIRINKTTVRVGSYKDEIEAAVAYDNAAHEHFGEYALLNFPEKERKL